MNQSTTDELGREDGEEPMPHKYTMRISRLTVDKLGVKLYDKVSAVLAELIANAYDADAEEVSIHAPMGKYLASKVNGQLQDKGFEIKIEDDGAGMTPEEMQEFFLVVGAERREDARRGPISKRFGRAVMGRKGVGKLAPFGICRVMEVLSAGGERVAENGDAGYRTSHIILNYDDIVAIGDEPDERYEPEVGDKDGTLSPSSGTTIALREFDYRKVSKVDVLAGQIAQRFGIRSNNWQVTLRDTVHAGDPHVVGEFEVDTMPNTHLTFSAKRTVVGPDGTSLPNLEAGFTHEERFYPVNGWMAYSKAPYRDELMAGVRIYCRGKIAAQTMVFNQRAGFTGEHNIRSYLVGELHANWLDEDVDLIQTDRRDILWSNELAAAFQEWGQGMVKHIGTLSRDPMRRATLETFMETGRVADRIDEQFPSESQAEIRANATELARMFGRTMSRAEVEDEQVVGDFVNLSLELAPHVTLDSKMREAAEETNAPFEVLVSLLRTARIAELASFGRIAEDRLKVISRLDGLKDGAKTDEADLQRLIADAPWLIDPEWAPVTANQTLQRLRSEFAEHYRRETGEEIELANFEHPKRRPDFVLSSQDGIAQIIEIKKPRHPLSNAEMERIVAYHDCMESFLRENAEFRKRIQDFHITLVCDDVALSGSQNAVLRYMTKLTRLTWRDFLLRTETVHKDFLAEAGRQKQLAIAGSD